MAFAKSSPLGRALDLLAFTGLWPAAVAAGLVAACADVLVDAPALGPRVVGMALAMGGTLVVYNVDRLRDIEGDRRTAPERSRFVDGHRESLAALAVASAGACIPLAMMLPPPSWWVCAAALGLGLFHRRLKGRRPGFAIFYVTLAWVAVVVGIPAAVFVQDKAGIVTALLAASAVGPAIAANLMASELRGEPHGPARRRRLRVAGAIALAGCLGVAGDPATRPLLAIPLCALASVAGFRNHERYGLLVLDGALFAGALAAMALSGA